MYKASHQLVAMGSQLYIVSITMPTRQNLQYTHHHISTRMNYTLDTHSTGIQCHYGLDHNISEAPALQLFKAGLVVYTIPSNQLKIPP